MDKEVLTQLFGVDEYTERTNPKLSRRQRLALEQFQILNRERTYLSMGDRIKPDYIKQLDIERIHGKLVQPISLEFFTILIQSLDDTFIEVSTEQLSNNNQ